MTESLLKRSRRYREVSDLRTQFQCEYRLYLKQKIGATATRAALMGSRLHEQINLNPEVNRQRGKTFRIAVLLLTILAAVFWVFG